MVKSFKTFGELKNKTRMILVLNVESILAEVISLTYFLLSVFRVTHCQFLDFILKF